MKVGFSYSRCLRDIFEGKVNEDDVIVIIARTHFDPNEPDQWKSIWNGYTGRGEWTGLEAHEDEMRELTLNLYNDGKIHQPRKFGGYTPRADEYWYDLITTKEVNEENPAVKKAWEQYKILANLA